MEMIWRCLVWHMAAWWQPTLAGRVSQPTLEGRGYNFTSSTFASPPAALLVGGTAFPPVIGLGDFAPALQQGICDRGNPCNLLSSSKVTNICELNILAVNCKWTLNSVEVREGMRRHASSLGHASNWRWKSHEPRLRAAAERRVL